MGVDKIDLTGLGYTGLAAGNASTDELRLIYRQSTNRPYIQDDNSDFEFYLKGDYRATLTQEDFLFGPPKQPSHAPTLLLPILGQSNAFNLSKPGADGGSGVTHLESALSAMSGYNVVSRPEDPQGNAVNLAVPSSTVLGTSDAAPAKQEKS
ncbi:MAG: hypothetical protein ACRERE_15690 [Candidatus Entotheonellia bacterium]